MKENNTQERLTQIFNLIEKESLHLSDVSLRLFGDNPHDGRKFKGVVKYIRRY